MATGTSRAGTPPLPSALVAGQRWRRVFPGEERQISALRRWLTSLLPGCEARDNVIAVASELGSNAVKHTLSGQGGWFAVEITWYVSATRVAVADCGGAVQAAGHRRPTRRAHVGCCSSGDCHCAPAWPVITGAAHLGRHRLGRQRPCGTRSL